jgi:endo-1,4-beta-xylanase
VSKLPPNRLEASAHAGYCVDQVSSARRTFETTQKRKHVGSRLRLPHLIAIGGSALLVLVSVLVAGFTAAFGGSSGPTDRPWDAVDRGLGRVGFPTPDSPLRELAGDRLRIGSAVNVDALTDETYRSVLATEFNAETAENAMKWSAVEPRPGEYDRAAADELIAFARQHDQEVYGHTLVWHKQVPEWVRNTPMTNAELRSVLHRHIQDEVTYFKGDVWAWDVVNEPLEEDGTLRDSLWLTRLGPDYIADALRWAREADPDAKLYLNDYGIEAVNAKSDGLYNLVTQLLARDVPLDGVGFQVHWTLDPLPKSFTENLQRFASLGLEVAITELDVRISEPVTAEKLHRQGLVYEQAAQACLAVERCTSLTVWGFTDAYSWVPSAYPGSGAAAVFDEEFRPKPAYASLAQELIRP